MAISLARSLPLQAARKASARMVTVEFERSCRQGRHKVAGISPNLAALRLGLAVILLAGCGYVVASLGIVEWPPRPGIAQRRCGRGG